MSIKGTVYVFCCKEDILTPYEPLISECGPTFPHSDLSKAIYLRPELFNFLVLGRAHPTFSKITIKTKVHLNNFISFFFPSDHIFV